MTLVDTSSSPLDGMTTSELVDVAGAARLLGLKPGTIRTMRARGQMPEPYLPNVNGGSVWQKSQIDEFIETRKGESGETVPQACLVADHLPKVVDLFAGCGGLSLGFQRAGFEVLAGIDNWDEALEVYRVNMTHPAVKLDLSDVDLAVAEVQKWVGSGGIMIGGPPCQDFSSAGKRVEGLRADLTVKFAEAVAEVQPEAFVMENVERAKSAQVFDEALRVFRAAGYGITVRVMNAAYCGVPQARKRLFTVGVLGAEDNFLNTYLDEHLSEVPTTLRDYFGDELDFDHYYRHPRSYARRGVFSVDEPSPTIRGVNRPVPGGYPGHAGDTADVRTGDVKPLSTAMRARIQTFPRGYYFGRTKTAAEQMIGNAVPVDLAKHVARALRAFIEDRDQ